MLEKMLDIVQLRTLLDFEAVVGKVIVDRHLVDALGMLDPIGLLDRPVSVEV